MKIMPYGDRAVLAEFEDLESTIAAYASMEDSKPSGVLGLVPAARTVLVSVDPERIGLRALVDWINSLEVGTAAYADSKEVTIPIRYDGADLEEVAKILGRSTEALIDWHLKTDWVCAFIGFAPGFAYLAGGGLSVPRLETSRPEVPRGSVALAGEFCGIYPRNSPGGWRIIGTTEAELWDGELETPALITPRTRVKFEAVSR